MNLKELFDIGYSVEHTYGWKTRRYLYRDEPLYKEIFDYVINHLTNKGEDIYTGNIWKEIEDAIKTLKSSDVRFHDKIEFYSYSAQGGRITSIEFGYYDDNVQEVLLAKGSSKLLVTYDIITDIVYCIKDSYPYFHGYYGQEFRYARDLSIEEIFATFEKARTKDLQDVRNYFNKELKRVHTEYKYALDIRKKQLKNLR